MPTFDRLPKRIGRRAIGETLLDRRCRGHPGNLLPPADPLRHKVLIADDVVAPARTPEPAMLAHSDMYSVGVDVTDAVGVERGLMRKDGFVECSIS